MIEFPKIKFCGLSKLKDIEVAIKLNINWAGLIYVKSSPRYVNFQTSDRIIKKYINMINFVGVFVDPDDDYIERAIKSGIDTIQLHGKETPERCAYIGRVFQLPIIKAFSIYSEEDLKNITNYKDCCDMFLFDAKKSKKDINIGGNGKSFDWNIIKNNESWLNSIKPWFLSGGLSDKNILNAINLTKAKAVDISSGIEKYKGCKDSNLMKEFIFKLKRANNININNKFLEK